MSGGSKTALRDIRLVITRKTKNRHGRAGRCEISAIGGQSASADLLKLGLPGEWSFDPATEQQFVQGQVSPICK
jgi:hypothetical protein